MSAFDLLVVWGQTVSAEVRSAVLVPYDEYRNEICFADIAGAGISSPDGAVNVFDLLHLLAAWGPCPQ